MNCAAIALILIAAAILMLPAPRWVLCRVSEPAVRHPRQARWLGVRRTDDPFAVAAALDLFAVCLRTGLPVPITAAALARTAPGSLAVPLAETAELLALGAEPERAWAVPSTGDARQNNASAPDYFGELATLARRSARAGSALSTGVAELAAETRRRAHDDAHARAERAGVLVSGPLGLCFLPAFVCLGIAPVVIGLARTTLGGM
ncbi:MAG: type II secretion system F family protein [Gordonia sp. (in: high G+C Gram-positive bacteria)]